MTLSMYQASLPTIIRQLEAMSAYLGKGEEYAREQGMDVQELLDGRLAPDMHSLPKQVQIATDLAKGGAARLAGQSPPAYADDEATIPELRTRLAKTVEYLKTLSPADIDGSEKRPVTLKSGETEFHLEGQGYLLNFVLPNIFFHATTTYAILRNKGVPLGKRDFIGRL